MLIISFDSVGDIELDRLSQYPAVSSFLKKSAVFRDVRSVFVSNTYPIHTTVVTGVMPVYHGVIANTQPFPDQNPVWNIREDSIRVKTLWQAAKECGIKTAAVFWPVTAYSKTIRYNIPEAAARPGESQLLTSLKAGSALLQLKMYLRYRKLLDGLRQPNLDNFAAACMADILRKKNPGLALIHLTAYDSICHENGVNSTALKEAYEALDRNLAILLHAAGDRDVIIFSDHSQINTHTVVDPNGLLVDHGLLFRNKANDSDEKYLAGESGCFIECCGGSAFFHAGKLEPKKINELRDKISASEWFCRYLTAGELMESGYSNATIGFCAKEGFCFDACTANYKANHGYPLDTPDYKVFYIVKSSRFTPGTVTYGGSLLDIAPLAAKLLGIRLPN